MGATGNAFELTVTLQQQTRMIHFQRGEEGVCLRASEVKPKLDRFIFSLLGGGDSPEEIEEGYRQAKKDKKWTIGEHRSLDYKMKIRVPSESDSGDCNCHPLYFADQIKLAIFYKESIELTIICFNKELREMIEKNIALFFVLHNFGTRQTKGFGSFLVKTVEGKDNPYDPFKILKDYYLNKLKRSFIFTKVSPASDWDSLNVAKTLYNLLKGGINLTSTLEGDQRAGRPFTHTPKPGLKKAYEKSFLTCIFLNKEIQNKKIESEKEYIKRVGYLGNYCRRPLQAQGNYQFLRALLGLPEYYDFPIVNTVKKMSIKVEDSSRGPGDNNGINRFASPILIKIFDDYVIFLPGLIPDELFDREFRLKGVEQTVNSNGEKQGRGKATATIRTPTIETSAKPNSKLLRERFLSQFLVDFARHFNTTVKDKLKNDFGDHDFYDEGGSTLRISELTIEVAK